MPDRGQTVLQASGRSRQANPAILDPAFIPSSLAEDASGANPIDLDANATTRPLPEVVDEVARVMAGSYGNPSSPHWLGEQTRHLLERARDDVTTLLHGCLPEGIVFTSGGTEANNSVLRSAVAECQTLITSEVEHASILEVARSLAGLKLILVGVSSNGLLDPDALAAAASSTVGPVCVSVQWANSETGVVQPMRDICAAVRNSRPDAFIHSDVAQAIGRVPIDMESASLDVVTFSGHKIHGPQGTGAIALQAPEDRRLHPFILGGGQERGRRSGTQNVAGCAGLGVAARLRANGLRSAAGHLAALREEFERTLLGATRRAQVNGAGAPRVPNTISVRFPGLDAMSLVARLDARGLACSMGSACSAGRPEPSHVLTAMGLSEAEAFSTVRFSFSILNTMGEAARAARLVARVAGEVG